MGYGKIQKLFNRMTLPIVRQDTTARFSQSERHMLLPVQRGSSI